MNWHPPPLYLYMAVRGNITLFYLGSATTEVWCTWIALTPTPAVSVHGRQRKYHFVLFRPSNNRSLVHMNWHPPPPICTWPSEVFLSPESQNSRVVVNVKWFNVKWFNVKWFKAHWGFKKQKTNMIKLYKISANSIYIVSIRYHEFNDIDNSNVYCDTISRFDWEWKWFNDLMITLYYRLLHIS